MAPSDFPDQTAQQTVIELLGDLEATRTELADALKEEQDKFARLAEEVNERLEALLRKRKRPRSLGAAAVNRLIRSTPQQKEIERIRRRRKAAETHIDRIWQAMRIPLHELHCQEATADFEVIRELDRQPLGLKTTDERIVLVKNILRTHQRGTTPAPEHIPTAATPNRRAARHETNQQPNPGQVSARWREDKWPERLKQARLDKKQTLKEAAAECDLPMQTYRKWEEGRSPAQRNVPRILRYMDLCISDAPTASATK